MSKSLNNINKKALIAKIKKQTDSFDTVVLHEDEANALLDELEVATDACNGWQRKFAEADERLEAAEKRIAELDAREVKLPERYDIELCPMPAPNGEWYARDDVLAALATAGVHIYEEG
ncbi:Uncharacterised protein [Enterobacter hormaechei]|uniref:hypothetical protein n=1 Tax=Enterobacter cloacae complex TaxID=354276 RepID=UPI0012548C22|nr:hypothetical protein [Enterobacter hormaechei]MED5624082.1 hypothetical protein [Enterobacter hormaechei]MED5714371.1 hypothetical protein [Enterobacter hormaechei]VAE97656.1 Uncharacterised protein [Enterobacter hormaechei]